MEDKDHEKTPLSKSKRRAFKVFAVVGGLLFGLLAAEVCLRIVGYSYPQFYMADEHRGYSLVPDMKGWYRKEGTNWVEISTAGLRDIEHSISKPANTVRIAVLGDSYSEAFQVPLGDAFWKVTQQKLQECGVFNGQAVEVINFGVSGYGTAQQLVTLREMAWKYEPDIVLLAMTTTNDITDNSRYFKKTPIPYFVDRNGSLVLDQSFREERSFRMKNSFLGRSGNWLVNNLRILHAIHQFQIAFKYKLGEWRKSPPDTTTPNSAEPQQDAPAVAVDVGIDVQIYRPPSDAAWEDAWRITERIISQMNDEVEHRGANLLVVTLSSGPQVLPDPRSRAAFAKMVGTDDLMYPDRRIESWCRQHGIRIIPLAPELKSFAEKNNVFLHGFDDNIGYGHWNAAGHRAAGEMLARKVCEGALR